MSDLRFLQELGAEFERISESQAKAHRPDRDRRRGRRIPPRALSGIGLGLSLLVVVAVVAVSFGLHGGSPGPSRSVSSPGPSRGVRIVFSATALNPRSPLGPAIDRSIEILRRRLSAFFHDVRVLRAGNGLVVVVPEAKSTDQARILALTSPGRLEFYDWEANALTPHGKTVASQLQAQDQTALTISQGSGGVAPGEPGAGSLSLYQAVMLASRQPPVPTGSTLARLGPEYYMFGAPGSAACAAAAKYNQTTPIQGKHCPLSGPDTSVQNLDSALPPGVSASAGQILTVPQGTVVLQAANPSASDQVNPTNSSAQFYVLKDNVSLSSQDITNPRPSTDQAGQPDLQFGFSSSGASKFQQVTATIAHRGQNVSLVGQTYNQHFAVALDNQLVTVPQIDFRQYPDGIIGGGGGGDITGGFTVQSARNLATQLRLGALPVSLVVR